MRKYSLAGKQVGGSEVVLSLTRQLEEECPRPSNAFAAFGLVVPNLKEVVDSLYHHGYGTPISRARVPYLLRLPSFHSPSQDAAHGILPDSTPPPLVNTGALYPSCLPPKPWVPWVPQTRVVTQLIQHNMQQECRVAAICRR